jgi:hypothetical protein
MCLQCSRIFIALSCFFLWFSLQNAGHFSMLGLGDIVSTDVGESGTAMIALFIITFTGVSVRYCHCLQNYKI